MPLHLIKLAVGVDDLDHMAEIQNRRAVTAGGVTRIPLHTRHVPKRAAEILEGGSLYWVIRGSVAVRQRIVAIDSAVDVEGGAFCLLQLDGERIATVPTPHRPFQGWRYLEAEKAPPDLTGPGGVGEDLPPHLLAELRSLGLM